MIKRYAVLLLALAVIITGVSAAWRHAFATVRSGRVATVSVHPGGNPMVISACVSDLHGQAVSGVTLNFVNNSGDNMCVTDAAGRSSVSVGETDLEEIQISGTTVARWPHTYLLSHPSVVDGLFVSIVVKDVEQIRGAASKNELNAIGNSRSNAAIANRLGSAQ